MSLIVLNMIVKNEASIITRCLASAVPWIDTWCIVDTGSTDNTCELIENFFKEKGMKGVLHRRPWVNFEHNRNEALTLARELVATANAVAVTGYCMAMDADEIFTPGPEFKMPTPMTASMYMATIVHGSRFERPRFYRCDDYEWWYPTHEVIMYIPKHRPEVRELLANCWVDSRVDGSRAGTGNARWLADAAQLVEAIKVREAGKLWHGRALQLSRLYFYAANSYMNAGLYGEALEYYTKRTQIAEFAEETYKAHCQRAAVKERLGRSVAEVVAAYMEAFLFRPSRHEPIASLVYYLVEKKQYGAARIYAAALLDANTDTLDTLFVEESYIEGAKELARNVLNYSCLLAHAEQQNNNKLWADALASLARIPVNGNNVTAVAVAVNSSYGVATLLRLYDAQSVSYWWLNRRAESRAALEKIFAMDAAHLPLWRHRLVSLVDSYTKFNSGVFADLPGFVKDAYAELTVNDKVVIAVPAPNDKVVIAVPAPNDGVVIAAPAPNDGVVIAGVSAPNDNCFRSYVNTSDSAAGK
jgi:glycosyltransferase involved in cell wall biosynthesis